MASADNFRTREQQLYKNLHQRGRSLVTMLHIFSKLYIFGLSRRSFTVAKATGFKFGAIIDQVSTNQKTEICPQKGHGLSHVTYIYIFISRLISSKPLTLDTSNIVHTLTTTCSNRKSGTLKLVWLAEKPRDAPYHLNVS